MGGPEKAHSGYKSPIYLVNCLVPRLGNLVPSTKSTVWSGLLVLVPRELSGRVWQGLVPGWEITLVVTTNQLCTRVCLSELEHCIGVLECT